MVVEEVVAGAAAAANADDDVRGLRVSNDERVMRNDSSCCCR